MIDRITVDKILDAANIVDVVSDFVTLKRAGANLKGLCPFHDDHTPSFVVSPARNTCKCFSCGKGGNAVHFVMEHEQMSYPEALKWLAKKYGIEVKERELSDEEKEQMPELCKKVIEGIKAFATIGPDRAMNVLNIRPKKEL